MNRDGVFTRSRLAIAGLLLFFAGFIVLMGIITGEAYYPSGYNTHDNEISDLGGTRPPNSVITQPSAAIFDTTMIVTGILIMTAAYFVHLEFRELVVTIPLGLFGLGALGVGVFPGNFQVLHPIFALLTFVSGGIAAILSYRITGPPLRYVFICLGSIALTFLFLSGVFIPSLGKGGTERWIAYPIVFWMTGLGAYLLGLYGERSSREQDLAVPEEKPSS